MEEPEAKPDADLLAAELERMQATLKVIEMQTLFNAEIKKIYSARLSWGAIKWKVPEFCHGVFQHENFKEFQDLTLGEVLYSWGFICNMKPAELTNLEKMTRERIEWLKKELSE